MKRTALGVVAVLFISACSGSDGRDEAVSATTSSTDTVATDVVVLADPAPTTIEAVLASPTTTGEASSGTAPVDPESSGDSTSDAPFVINGPASVDDGTEAEMPSAEAAESVADCSATPPGLTNTTLDAGGGVHDVRIYVPDNLAAEPAPTVIDWHGLGSNGAEQAAYTGYEDLADLEGFIVVHPTGLPVVGATRNAWELAAFDLDGRDDLAFADALFDELTANYCTDPSRIYSTGMSNGGFFTAELVCNRSDRIAAAVSVGGLTHHPDCAPMRDVPYIAFHGTDDLVVPFDGSGESVLIDEGAADDALGGGADFFLQVMPDEFAEFTTDANCDVDPVRNEVTPEVIEFRYTGCDDDTPMSFYEVVGGGHTWPGSPIADLLGERFGFHTQDISATIDGWNFMKQFTL